MSNHKYLALKPLGAKTVVMLEARPLGRAVLDLAARGNPAARKCVCSLERIAAKDDRLWFEIIRAFGPRD